MSKLRKHVIGVLAAAAVATTSLAAPQPVSAATNWSCATRLRLADLYELTGYMFEMASEWEYAAYYYGLADGVRGGC